MGETGSKSRSGQFKDLGGCGGVMGFVGEGGGGWGGEVIQKSHLKISDFQSLAALQK